MSLESLATPATDELRFAVAYATTKGCKTLMPRLEERIGYKRWSKIPKTVILTTDFHLTEPHALTYLRSLGWTVCLSQPARSHYHPKVYAFVAKGASRALVGSANLTQAALTDNVEAATMSLLSNRRDFELAWNELLATSVELTDPLLKRYVAERRRKPPGVVLDRESAPAPRVSVGTLTIFSDAVAVGLAPASFNALWVEARGQSGGSDNQLELPREAYRFFRLGGGHSNHLIGQPVLVSGGSEWTDRKLTWHGQGKMNTMERLNLPTLKMGGFPYAGATILFVRERSRYRLTVARTGDPVVRAWRRASRAAGHEYRLGRTSPRRCGLF
ncbi:MAG TPA: phospholipase D family protein [Solirubrobacteraceae bacterium]|nr:phospholipase D family protein [Solirubrobacteraceae bacterium]